MAKSLSGWNTVRALQIDEGNVAEATALFSHQKGDLKEKQRIRGELTKALLGTFLKQSEASNLKKEAIIKEEGILDQGIDLGSTELNEKYADVKMFERREASKWNPLGGKFRKVEDRIQLSEDFQNLMRTDDQFRLAFLESETNQRFLSKMDRRGFYSQDKLLEESGIVPTVAVGPKDPLEGDEWLDDFQDHADKELEHFQSLRPGQQRRYIRRKKREAGELFEEQEEAAAIEEQKLIKSEIDESLRLLEQEAGSEQDPKEQAAIEQIQKTSLLDYIQSRVDEPVFDSSDELETNVAR